MKSTGTVVTFEKGVESVVPSHVAYKGTQATSKINANINRFLYNSFFIFLSLSV